VAGSSRQKVQASRQKLFLPDARQARGLATLLTRFGFAGKKQASPTQTSKAKGTKIQNQYNPTMVRTKKHFRPPSSSSSSSSEEEEDDDEINHQVPTGRGKQLGNFGRGKQLNMASQQGRGKQLRA
jgi:hypothetical protein